MVVVNGTNRSAVEETERRIKEQGGAVVPVVGSIAETSVCKALIDASVTHFGGVDCLVSNAGIVRDRTLVKMTDEDFDQVIGVNLRGSFVVAREFAIQVRKQETGGSIVHVDSIAGVYGNFGQTNYAASKGGMMAMLRTWVHELAPHNIRVNAIWPSAETDMTQVILQKYEAAAKSAGKPIPSAADLGIGKAEEVAQGVLYLASEKAQALNGQYLSFTGRNAGLWHHPRETHVLLGDSPLTVDQLAEHFDGVELPSIYPGPEEGESVYLDLQRSFKQASSGA
jgi:3-oxoacyl-[acyl-carrier protein] reductase